MQSWFSAALSKWTSRRRAAAVTLRTAAPTRAPGAEDLPRYPPSDPGIQAVALEQVIAAQDELIQRIFRTSGVSRADFSKLIEPSVRNLAANVHLLPATANGHHRGQGGLYRLGLALGLYALQAAHASIFPVNGGVERRFHMQPRWCLATMLAGMCCQIHRPIVDLTVVTDQNESWPAFLEPLYDWLTRVNATHYYVRWREATGAAGGHAAAAYLIDRIVPKEVLQYLAADNNEIIPVMTGAISGADGASNQISRLLGPLIVRVIDEDLKHCALNYGQFSVGFHLEPHLIDAMRQLVRAGRWACNVADGVLWAGGDGVFLDWDRGAQDLVTEMTRGRFVGVPTDPGTLADILFDADVFVRTHDGGRYWSIDLPTASGGTIAVAVKFSDRGLIFPPQFDMTQFNPVRLTKIAKLAPARPKAPVPMASPAPTAEATPVPSAPAGPVKENPPATLPDEPGSSGDLFADVPMQTSDTAPPEADPVGQGAPPERPKRDVHAQKPERKPRAPKPKKGEPAEVPPAPGAAPPIESGGLGEEVEPEDPADTPAAQWSPSAAAQARLKGLKDPSAWLLRQIIARFHSGLTGAAVLGLDHGVAIAHDELSAHGQSPAGLIDEMATLQWLWVDSAKPMRRVHTIGAEAKRVVILKPQVARDLELIGGGQ